LAARLRGRGFQVIRRTVYAAEPVSTFPAAARAALEEGVLCAALFLSAETARAFCRLLPSGLRPSLSSVEALAIGEPAALALKALPWRHVRVAARPTLDEVLALL
jgi:uroporphyrinogen-III synthase